ncbi:MAG TPA: hypothetical protein VF184_01225 [Phycisphaeraceae bacterium]
MRKIDQTQDYSGRPLERGDTVSTLNGHLTARVCDIATDGETTFVCLRPLHQPYSPGIWHAADRVIWVAAGANRRKKKNRDSTAKAQPASPSARQVSNAAASKRKI